MLDSVFANISPPARRAIRQFQMQAVPRYMSGRPGSGTRKLIQSIGEDLIADLGYANPPIDARLIARILNIRPQFRKVAATQTRKSVSGILVPVSDGFEARIFGDAEEWWLNRRTRFTLAHECGHALFFTMSNGAPKRIIPADGRSPRWEEVLCESFAGAVLMPSGMLSKRLVAEPRLSDIKHLADEFVVNIEPVVRRVLYDLSMYATHVYYRIQFGARAPKVTVLRGQLRRKHNDPAPIAKKLSAQIGDWHPDEVETKLQEQFSIAKEDTLQMASVLWVKM